MFFDMPEDLRYIYNLSLEEHVAIDTRNDRRLYLTGPISAVGEDGDCGIYGEISMCTKIVDDIIDYNRYDERNKIPVEERKPIRMYINSPGGTPTEGFAVISAIGLSKTPIYTINIGQWGSMAFLIGITGHKRFSIPYATFLMHDGRNGTFDSGSKAQDKMKFDERFELEVVKKHVLRHGKMTSTEYDALVRVEYYMLPEDALERGFIDEIVTDITSIL